MNRKIFDDHIWLSVGIRKTKSNFTRLQRLSVCLSLLFMTMIANAMWYRTEENKDSTQSLQFGPISFTVHQLFTSIMSSLICVPPVLVITILFRKAKAKPLKKDITEKNINEKTNDNNGRATNQSQQFRNLHSISSYNKDDMNDDTLSTLELYLIKELAYDNISDSDDDDKNAAGKVIIIISLSVIELNHGLVFTMT